MKTRKPCFKSRQNRVFLYYSTQRDNSQDFMILSSFYYLSYWTPQKYLEHSSPSALNERWIIEWFRSEWFGLERTLGNINFQLPHAQGCHPWDQSQKSHQDLKKDEHFSGSDFICLQLKWERKLPGLVWYKTVKVKHRLSQPMNLWRFQSGS